MCKCIQCWAHASELKSLLFAQVVFLGLDTVIPLMTGELLHFPKLIRAFFTLISYMLEVYPERVASLPGVCSQVSAEMLGCTVYNATWSAYHT